MHLEVMKPYIEKGLDEVDQARLWKLINQSNLGGYALLKQVVNWKSALKNKEPIVGTPWNLTC